MDHFDQLLTIAEVSVALAGFAGIVVTFQFRGEQRITRGQVISLSMIVYMSLLGALFSALPIALLNFGLSEPTTWATSSLIMGVNQAIYTIYLYRNQSANNVGMIISNIYRSLFILSSLAAIILVMNAFGIVFQREYGPVFTVFVFNLSLVGFTFSRLLMLPLWKSLRIQGKSSA